jgi:hypothetical protein
MQSLKFGIEGSMECRGTVHGWSTKHYSHVEVLFIDGVRSTVHKRRYCSWRTIRGVLFTSHSSRSAGWRATPDLWGGFDSAGLAIGFAHLACSGSGGSFLRIGLLQWFDMRASLGDWRCCNPEIGDVAALETGYAVAVWRSSGVVDLEVRRFIS